MGNKIEIEKTVLGGYTSEFERGEDYYEGQQISPEGWAGICRLKDKNNALLDKRVQAARAVIDLVAGKIGIDPEDTGYYLYAPNSDNSSPIVEKMDEFFSRSGDKVKLKKRIDELEAENSVLRSLLRK